MLFVGCKDKSKIHNEVSLNNNQNEVFYTEIFQSLNKYQKLVFIEYLHEVDSLAIINIRIDRIRSLFSLRDKVLNDLNTTSNYDLIIDEYLFNVRKLYEENLILRIDGFIHNLDFKSNNKSDIEVKIKILILHEFLLNLNWEDVN